MPNRTFTKTLANALTPSDIEGIISHARTYGLTLVAASTSDGGLTWTVTVNGTNALMTQFLNEQGAHLGLV